MSGELKYTIFDTGIGWVGILASAKGLLATTLPQPSAQEALLLLGNRLNQATWSPRPLADLIVRLKVYFSGHQTTFSDELDLSGATLFQRQVWEVTRLIPYGETRSYLWVAKQMKRPGAVRVVGQALGRNPLPIIIPCHRVVASNGKLGGFSGGAEMKRCLLAIEASAGS
ncbi:MAG: methylated-DNA--[protein]-cysteine S-methyltransferase [Chloroflexi bacterium]|nr:methylated-DNA--[protein]-cysteine S-methyltransferase [Chloroflexota bacterium]